MTTSPQSAIRMPIREEVQLFLRDKLAERLAQCTEKQRALFAKVYPSGVPESRLYDAIDLCDRTIDANEKVEP